MIHKFLLYKDQQQDIINKIINIIQLDNNNSFLLFDIDNNQDKINNILNLIPEIKKYFTSTNIMGVRDASKVKRPYLSIIKQIIKSEYKIFTCYVRINNNNYTIRTKKYTLIKNDFGLKK